MYVGDTNLVAIESHITRASIDTSIRAIGSFVIYIKGLRYGVASPEATALACSFDEVQRRLADRGKHVAPFASDPDPKAIAVAFRDACYGLDQEGKRFLGISGADFSRIVNDNRLIWAPDGDEAFDDGSFILQFDIGEDVRMIGMKCAEGHGIDAGSLRDVVIRAELYYAMLQRWLAAFEAEWSASIASGST